MSFTARLNGKHDLSINKGRLAYVYGEEEVGQRVLVALRHYYNEYFLDVPDGVPWYEVILGSKDRRTVELILRRKILEVPGVVSIISIDMIPSRINQRELELYIAVEVVGYQGTVSAGALQLKAMLSAKSNEFASQSIEFAASGWQFGA